MRFFPWRVVFTSLAGIASAACFDFSSGSPPPLDSGAPDSTTAHDSGSSSSGDDSSTPSDAGPSDSGPLPFCTTPDGMIAGKNFFCDDFDQGDFATFWTLEQSNGSVTLDTAQSKSAPSSMNATSKAIGASDQVRAVSKFAFSSYSDERVDINVQFDMYVDTFDPSPGKQVMAFQLLDGPLTNFNQIVLNLNSTGTSITAQLTENAYGPNPDAGDVGYGVHGPFTLGPKIKKWSHVEIDVNILHSTGTGNTLKVFFDGVNVANDALSLNLKGGQPRMELGLGYVQPPAQSWTIYYDNFVAKVIQ